MTKFIEFKDRNTKLRVILGMHEFISIHEQVDGSVILNDNRECRSYYPEETYEDLRARVFSLT